MKKNAMKTAAIALSGVMAAGLLSGCGEAKLNGTKTVATVDETKIPMGLLSLAVRSEQASLEYMYSYYIQAGYISSIWDQTVDEDGKETYGDQTVSDVLDEIELMYLLKSHAADYGVELTADDEKAIADAAAKFMSDNTEEAIEELAVTEDQVKEYLELQTYRSRMYDPIVADVDTEVSDEEAQQSSFTYVSIPLDEEEELIEAEDTDEETAETEEDADAADDEDAEAAEEEEAADDEDAEAEEAADNEDAEDAEAEEAADDEDTEAAEAEEAADGEDGETEAEDTLDAQTKAEELLAAMQKDPSADMTEIAKTIDDSLSSYQGTFTTNETKDEDSEEEDAYSAYPDELLDALRELKDGELVSEVIKTDNGYYVARLDEAFDEAATESEKESIVSDRKDAYYTEVTDGWRDAAKITVDDKVLATLKLTDSHTFTLKVDEEEDAELIDDDEDIELVDEDEELEEDVELIDEDDLEDAELIEEEAASDEEPAETEDTEKE